MIIVIENDYDYSETIGVFETLDKALDYMRKNNLKPQHYRIEEIINETEFKSIEIIPQWCEESKCNLDRGLQKFNRWNKMYCPPHYDNAVIEGNKQDRLYKLRQAEANRIAEEQRIKRIKFEKKWDINGYWYSNFIYEGLSEKETKEKVDHWKDSNNWMSGSSFSRVVEPRKKDEEE